MTRIVIDASEVAILINRDIKTAQRLLRTIKDVLKKKKHQRITIREFCDHEDFPFEDIFSLINRNKEEADAAKLSKAKNSCDAKENKKSS